MLKKKNLSSANIEKSIDHLKLPIDDLPDESISEYLEDVCNFIGDFLKESSFFE